MKSEKTETIDVVEYQLVLRDVTMDSHPAFTGEKRFVDTAGRVEKFMRRYGNATDGYAITYFAPNIILVRHSR